MRIPLENGGYIENDDAVACYRHMLTVLGGWVEEDGALVIQPLQDVEVFRAWALGEVERRREEAARAYTKPVYAIKVRAAERVLAGTKTAELELEAAARGITQAELAQQILQAAVAAAREIDRIEAWAYRARAAIKKAQTIKQIIAVLAEEEA